VLVPPLLQSKPDVTDVSGRGQVFLAQLGNWTLPPPPGAPAYRNVVNPCVDAVSAPAGAKWRPHKTGDDWLSLIQLTRPLIQADPLHAKDSLTPASAARPCWIVPRVMSVFVDGCLESEDCGPVMSKVMSGRVSAFTDASTLVRSCFNHSVGAVKQLVGRGRTDLDAVVSSPSLAVSVCRSSSSSSRCMSLLFGSRRWFRRASTATRTKCEPFCTRRRMSTIR